MHRHAAGPRGQTDQNHKRNDSPARRRDDIPSVVPAGFGQKQRNLLEQHVEHVHSGHTEARQSLGRSRTEFEEKI